jgi:hypothetical protein
MHDLSIHSQFIEISINLKGPGIVTENSPQMTNCTSTHIEIRVCAPHEPVRKVMTRRLSLISALQCLWPTCPKCFIFQGRTLLESMTFEFYGVCDGDSIIALPNDSDRGNLAVLQEWLSVTRDMDALNETIRSILNPATTRQVARLRDLHWMALERRPRQYQRMITALMDTEQRPSFLRSTVIKEPPKTPSVEAMPVLWNLGSVFGSSAF